MTRDEVAETDPVARVAVDVAHAHLDRAFDYLVPRRWSSDARPGVRVRVRFAGRLVDGFILERCAASPHEGRLVFLDRVVSPEAVLTSEVLTLARAVAARWAGTLFDVLRLAVPPRHARAEAAPPPPAGSHPAGSIEEFRWDRYRDGRRLVQALQDGGVPRAVWAALPGGGPGGGPGDGQGDGWPEEIADLVVATASSGRGALVVAPDARDVTRLDKAVSVRLGADSHVVLTAELGPAERYRRFLAVSRGQVKVVIGNRGAAFAPVADLGLVVIWDDGDDLHAEPRAPYPHAREVLLLRAQQQNAAAVVGGYAVTAEGARLVATGWARLVTAERTAARAAAPRVVAAEDPASGREPAPPGRLPSQAWRAAHDALRAGAPVLVQVPRRGYLPALACEACRTPLRCEHCGGPLATVAAGGHPCCRWCGRFAGIGSGDNSRSGGWSCPECGSARFRAVVVGARRTAEELGRAFPGVAVRTSAHGQVLDRVAAEPLLVIATPGAEPVADGGYGAALLLDGWALLGRADLRAAEEALRRWLNAAALVRPAASGGHVVVLADPRLRPVQALVRWDPAGHAERELADRRTLGFPPAAVFVELAGESDAVREFLDVLVLPPGTQLLGPVPSTDGPLDGVRALVRGSRAVAADLATRLHEAAAVRSARKLPPVRIRVDPQQVG